MRVRILLTLFCLGLTAGPSLSGQSQPTDRVARLLEELSDAPGPSGFEGPVREIVARELRGDCGRKSASLRCSIQRPL